MLEFLKKEMIDRINRNEKIDTGRFWGMSEKDKVEVSALLCEQIYNHNIVYYPTIKYIRNLDEARLTSPEFLNGMSEKEKLVVFYNLFERNSDMNLFNYIVSSYSREPELVKTLLKAMIRLNPGLKEAVEAVKNIEAQNPSTIRYFDIGDFQYVKVDMTTQKSYRLDQTSNTWREDPSIMGLLGGKHVFEVTLNDKYPIGEPWVAPGRR